MKLTKDFSKDSADRRICPFKQGNTCSRQCVFYDEVENYTEPYSKRTFVKANICTLADIAIQGWIAEPAKVKKVNKVGTKPKRNRKKR